MAGSITGIDQNILKIIFPASLQINIDLSKMNSKCKYILAEAGKDFKCMRNCTEPLLRPVILNNYRISSNNSPGDYFYFRTRRGRLFEGRRLFDGGDYFKYISQEIAPKIFCFITSSNKGKSKIHECYLRKNCKRKTGAFVTIQLHSVVCYPRCQFLI